GAAARRPVAADDVGRMAARLRQVQLLPVPDPLAGDARGARVCVRSGRLRGAGAVDWTGALLHRRYSACVRISVVIVAILRSADSGAEETLRDLRFWGFGVLILPKPQNLK